MPIEEQWKPVPDFPNYEVSNLGRVRHIKRKVLKPDTPKGYHRVKLCHKGRQKRAMIHALVATVFIGPLPAGKEHNHKDGNPSNNRVDNLEYVTKSENQLHSYRELNKPHQAGSAHGRHILLEGHVLSIRYQLSLGVPQAIIAADYGVSVPTISMIKNRRTWRHI